MPNFAVIHYDRDAFPILSNALGTPWFQKKSVEIAYDKLVRVLNRDGPERHV